MSRMKNHKLELNDEELKKVQRIFSIYDDGKGIIKLSELLQGMEESGVKERNPLIYELISQLNTVEYRNGITLDELINQINKKVADRNSEEAITRLFQYFVDYKDKSTINMDDIIRLANEIGDEIEEEQVKRLMNKIAKNGKDLNFEEFYAVMTKKAQL